VVSFCLNFTIFKEMKIITPYAKDKGDIGVDFTEQHYSTQGVSFKRASKLEDHEKGIDVYIDKVATDVKNTPDIFFCQFSTEDGKMNTRHPFKKKSKVTHYCVVNVPKDDITKGKFVEHIGIKDRLLRDFFKDKTNMEEFYKTVQSFEGKHMKDFGISQSQACFKIKQMIVPFLQLGVGCSYVEPSEADGEVSFRLFKSKRKTTPTTPQNLNIKDILSRHKDIQTKLKEENPTSNTDENIIVVNV
jgi:hypothetical protein